jgi:threonylcarbamoyladenosine tRNA methylthiotransferase MtaB
LPKASFHTLGCRLNQAETAIMAKSLKSAGYEIVDSGYSADVTVINTCTVTEQADAKCRQAVRKILRKSPETFVAVVGCYAQMAVEKIGQIPGVDLIIGNEHKLKIVDYLNGNEKNSQPLIVHSPKISREEFTIDSYGLYENSTRANLKLQDGCNFVCNFCIIPTARGPARSRNLTDIIHEAEKLVDLGHQELVLTGVNIGSYRSRDGEFLDIIDQLETINNLKRIRISSIEPTTIPPELIYRIAESEKMCKHLHIPLQSADDQVLKSMRRKYNSQEFADFIQLVDDNIPNVGIGTDVLVGYPTENEQAFVNTKKFLGDLPISYYHVFTYSDREGTGSYRMPNKIPVQEKKRRTRIMIEQGQRKKIAFYEESLGTVQSVLFEQTSEGGNWVGYSSNYMNIEVSSAENLHNQMREVKLLEVREHSILGEILN